MRLRSLTIASLAVASLALAGCGGGESPDGDTETPVPSADETIPEDLCDAASPTGDAIESVEVTGDFGESAEATFDAPLEIDDFERSVVAEGEGDEIEAGAYVHYAATIYDAESGEKLGSEGYGDEQTVSINVETNNAFGAAFGCATPGTRVVFAFPGQQGQDGTAVPSQLLVLDLIDTVPMAATGEPQDAPAGFPEVDVAEDGTPSVTVPDGLDAPDETEVATLIEGDGATVEEDDIVVVQYQGVRASDGSEFDSSWTRGAPMQPTQLSGLVTGFQKALVGQNVGSQVIAVIPPEEGYGGNEGHELQDETLIFVVDILSATHATSE